MGLGIPEMMLIGAGTGLLAGGGLKGAVKGAALGGIGGGIGNALQGAGAAGTVGTGLSAGAVPTSAGAFEAAMGLPSSAFIGAGGSLGTALGGTASQMGLNTIGAGSTLYNPEYFANVLGNPVYKGGEGLLSNLGGGILSGLPDYVTPQNLMGAANIINNTQMPQRQFAPAGGVSQGKTSGLNVEMGGARPIGMRRREDF